MGFTINKEIKTVLTYQDIALITSMGHTYQKICGPSDQEQKEHSIDLVNRLGNEMSRYPINDFTKDPDGGSNMDDNGLMLMKKMHDLLKKICVNSEAKIIMNVVSTRELNELIEEVNAYLGNTPF